MLSKTNPDGGGCEHSKCVSNGTSHGSFRRLCCTYSILCWFLRCIIYLFVVQTNEGVYTLNRSTNNNSMLSVRWLLVSSFLGGWLVAWIFASESSTRYYWFAWSVAQTLLWPCTWWSSARAVAAGADGGFSSNSNICQSINRAAWQHWETQHKNLVQQRKQQQGNSKNTEPIPTVNVQEHRHDLLSHLEATFGFDWRRRPLLLQNLWTAEELRDDKRRRLTADGLRSETLEIPYFRDARRAGALSPDGRAPIRDIVANMTKDNQPHKIGTQLLVQTYPELISEVAPVDIVAELFGASYFSPQAVRGWGPFGWPIFPAMTTVPVFVASGTVANHDDDQNEQSTTTTTTKEDPPSDSQSSNSSIENNPFTALHCEPIGNVAVQLSGRKEWTLVRPEFSHLVRPSVSPDGRAFFASWISDYSQVPSYRAVTAAGDALWVGPWTWHRVDYMPSDELAIGGSLFHFRPVDFVRNNPLFALLILPAIFLEMIGFNTQ